MRHCHDLARPHATSAPGPDSPPATSAPRLGSPPCHICTGTLRHPYGRACAARAKRRFRHGGRRLRQWTVQPVATAVCRHGRDGRPAATCCHSFCEFVCVFGSQRRSGASRTKRARPAVSCCSRLSDGCAPTPSRYIRPMHACTHVDFDVCVMRFPCVCVCVLCSCSAECVCVFRFLFVRVCACVHRCVRACL